MGRYVWFDKTERTSIKNSSGPLFTKHVDAGQLRPFKGSAIVLNDLDRESILSRLAGDVYVKENIWDVNNALILPFRTLIRKAL